VEVSESTLNYDLGQKRLERVMNFQ
jgi:hypothetical protein